MSIQYDRAAAARYWGEERLAQGDDLAAVLSLREPRVVNEAYDRWESSLIVRVLEPLAGKIVVDVGCGTGRVAGLLVARGAHVVAADNARGMLERCRSHTSAVAERGASTVASCHPSASAGPRDGSLGSLALIQGEAPRLPLRGGSVGAAVCLGLLEHLPAELRARTLGELARVVRPGGRIALVANNARSELLQRTEDNPHRKGVQYDNGYFCELVGREEVESTLGDLGWMARTVSANTFYSLLRFRLHAAPPLSINGPGLERAFDVAVELDLATGGLAEPDRRWADHFFILAERS